MFYFKKYYNFLKDILRQKYQDKINKFQLKLNTFYFAYKKRKRKVEDIHENIKKEKIHENIKESVDIEESVDIQESVDIEEESVEERQEKQRLEEFQKIRDKILENSSEYMRDFLKKDFLHAIKSWKEHSSLQI